MKKKITAIALAVCILAVGIVGATMSYFTDKDTATNTFTFGEGVDIKLTESSIDWNDGKADITTYTAFNLYGATNGTGLEDYLTGGLTYDNVIPGRHYSKAPHVELVNSGKSDPAWIVVTATYPEGRPFNLGGQATVKDLLAASPSEINVDVTVEKVGNTYFYYFPSAVQPGTVVTPFQWMQLDGSVNNADTNAQSGPFNVEVKAYAVLAEGFDNVKEAFKAAFGNNAEFNGILGEKKSVKDTADAAGAATFTLDTVPAAASNEKTTVNLTGLTANAEYTLDATTYDAESATVPDGFTVTDGSGVIAALDLNLTDAEGDKVTFNGGEATVVTYIAKGIEGNPVVKYTGDDSAAQPTFVSYDSTTGKLVFKTTHFSNFAVLVSEAAYNKTTNTAYETLAKAVAAVGANETVVLTKDVTGGGVMIKEADAKTLTIDLNGKTYTFTDPAVGSNGTETQGFHFEKGCTITVKNGKLDAANNNQNVKMMIQNYCNLTLDGVEMDGTNLNGTGRYVLSNNCGTTTIKNSKITAKAGDFAFDSCKFMSYTVPTVNVIGSEINGKVEATGGKINFQTGTIVNGQVRVGENKAGGATGSEVTIEKGAVINNKDYAAVVFGKNTLNIAGEVNGIVGTNGNDYNGGSIINVNDGAVITKAGDVAMYIPNGTLNITGGTITGDTAVYFKSTNLNITGGTLIGNGAKAGYEYDGNGCNATGDALVIDSCNYPNGIDNVSISGGTFKSTNNNAVKAFTKDETCTPVTGFITGGKFSSNPDAAYLAAGATTTEVSGFWTVNSAK